MIKITRISQEIVLTLGAILGVICILAALAAVFFGVTPLIFRSGSMSPEIHTGALALALKVPASEIRVSDVVSAVNPQGTRVTHRVTAVSPEANGTVALTMQGDANEVVDPEPYLVAQADRVIWHLDGLGFVVQEVQKPPYVFAIGLLAGALLVMSVRSSRVARPAADQDTETDRADAGVRVIDEPPANSLDDTETDTAPGRRRKRAVVASTALVLAAAVAAGTLVGGHPLDTMALFTDQTGAVSASLASSLGVPFQPTNVTCSGTGTGGKDMTISWTVAATTPNAGYSIEGGPTANPTQTTSAGVVTVVFPSSAMTATTYTLIVSAIHFTNWPASASSKTVSVTQPKGKVHC
ncbi:signal peptidase I [Cryobacterium ruanii]|uniref:Signal peptidase I n=1 Tax=Cryobacterium ruanii TaxID=1259197 RepID=A0A4R9AQJ0_9MICO|nr:signal peptidase I [Cryobacterium ruanii]TFD68063.1 signal peptidase I [Cryobacterium ruanii]